MKTQPTFAQTPESPLLAHIEETLYSGEQIAARVTELGAEISRDYMGLDPLLVGVLRGVAVFIGDLVRAIPAPLDLDFMAISSYGTATRSSGVVRILKDLDENITGRHVLVVEDIIDTGLTLAYILKTLRARNPASMRVCALLNRSARRLVDVPIDYIGFDVPDLFVVGYGLDLGQRYRNLRYIGALAPESLPQ